MPRSGSSPAVTGRREPSGPTPGRAALLARAFAASPAGLGVLDGQQRLTEANPALLDLLGQPPLGTALPDLLDDPSAETLRSALGSLREAAADQRTRIRVVLRDGAGGGAGSPAGPTPAALTLSLRALGDRRPAGRRVVMLAERDDPGGAGTAPPADRLAALGRTALGGQPAAALLQEAVAMLVDVLDVDGACVMTQAGSEPALRLRASTGTGPPVGAVFAISPQGPAGLVMLTGEPVTIGESVEPGGEKLPFSASWYADGVRSGVFTPLGTSGQPHGVLAVLSRNPRDFSSAELRFLREVAALLAVDADRRRNEARTRHEAMHDPLTSLPNRALFDDRLGVALRAAGRHDLTVGVVLIDLDGFKDVNDTLGHAAGDRLLCGVADRLRGVLRAGDTIARLGGDEFGVCLPGPLDRAEAGHVADRLVASLSDPFPLSGLPVRVSASCGVALAPDHGRTTDTLLHRADVAMYRAKRDRSGWCWWDPAVDSAHTDRLARVLDLRRALAEDELVLYYQPIVDARTGVVVGTEALLRWPHPRRGLLLPADVLPLAEDAGIAEELACWVIRRAARQASSWALTGPTLPVSVNLTGAVLAGPDVVEALLEEQDRNALPAGMLTVEVSGAGLLAEPARRGLQRLADAGVPVAVDGFGNEGTPLASLRDLPLEMVKIDRSLTVDLDRPDDTGRRHVTMVDGVISLAHSLDLRVAAGGVETAATAARLRDLGADLLQGYLWGHPEAPGAEPPDAGSAPDAAPHQVRAPRPRDRAARPASPQRAGRTRR